MDGTGAVRMSHSVAWLCRAVHCRFPLGRVDGGRLRLFVPIDSVDSAGVLRVLCPQCGRARAWFPAKSPLRGNVVEP